jgi:hypothetical protein
MLNVIHQVINIGICMPITNVVGEWQQGARQLVASVKGMWGLARRDEITLSEFILDRLKASEWRLRIKAQARLTQGRVSRA